MLDSCRDEDERTGLPPPDRFVGSRLISSAGRMPYPPIADWHSLDAMKSMNVSAAARFGDVLSRPNCSRTGGQTSRGIFSMTLIADRETFPWLVSSGQIR